MTKPEHRLDYGLSTPSRARTVGSAWLAIVLGTVALFGSIRLAFGLSGPKWRYMACVAIACVSIVFGSRALWITLRNRNEPLWLGALAMGLSLLGFVVSLFLLLMPKV